MMLLASSAHTVGRSAQWREMTDASVDTSATPEQFVAAALRGRQAVQRLIAAKRRSSGDDLTSGNVVTDDPRSTATVHRPPDERCSTQHPRPPRQILYGSRHVDNYFADAGGWGSGRRRLSSGDVAGDGEGDAGQRVIGGALSDERDDVARTGDVLR